MTGNDSAQYINIINSGNIVGVTALFRFPKKVITVISPTETEISETSHEITMVITKFSFPLGSNFQNYHANYGNFYSTSE